MMMVETIGRSIREEIISYTPLALMLKWTVHRANEDVHPECLNFTLVTFRFV